MSTAIRWPSISIGANTPGTLVRVEPVSTQVIPRDRHAAYFAALGVIASTIERIATEIRHLQRTEVLEAEEYFSEGQKGSSAMPHKRNPMLCEAIVALARASLSVTSTREASCLADAPHLLALADQVQAQKRALTGGAGADACIEAAGIPLAPDPSWLYVLGPVIAVIRYALGAPGT